MENENITAAEGKPSGYKVTKKDLRNANWRWLMSVCTFNYQTQQGASVAYALSPILRKIYTNDEDYKQALNNLQHPALARRHHPRRLRGHGGA